ncbi:MAG: hypothetical protein PF481_07405 [Bacteroidales bacterium]|nr:hypothetical protein [Bacteroidales bacterium]
MQKSDVLLLAGTKTVDGSCAKVYDYLAAKKFILLTPNDEGTLQKIIRETNSGAICDTEKDVLETLETAYSEWQQTGMLACNSSNIEKYSRKEQAKRLATLISLI